MNRRARPLTATPLPPTRAAPGISRFALWGALGFGVGGALCGVLQAFVQRPHAAPSENSLVATFGFGIMGGLGGAALGWAARDMRLLQRLALTGLLGFGVGGLLNLLLLSATNGDASAEPPIFEAGKVPWTAPVYLIAALLYAVAFAVRGTIGGAVLGVALPGRHAVRTLSLVGAFGFAAGAFLVTGALLLPGLRVEDPDSPLIAVELCAVWAGGSAAIGGAMLGVGVGLLARPLRAAPQ
jgi:hypothetical protein